MQGRREWGCLCVVPDVRKGICVSRRFEQMPNLHGHHVSPRVLSWLVFGLLILVLPLSFVAAGTSVLPGDVTLTTLVQSHLPAAFTPLISATNLLGEAPSIIGISLTVATMLFLRGHRRPAALVAAASLAQAGNILLKAIHESPRPTGSLVRVSEDASGFGFPSGHTMSTTVLALVLFYVVTTLMTRGISKRFIQVGLLGIPLLMGVARVETGAHWPSDVLGAWLWGTLTAIVIVRLSQRIWNRQPSPAYQRARSPRNDVAIVDMRGD